MNPAWGYTSAYSSRKARHKPVSKDVIMVTQNSRKENNSTFSWRRIFWAPPAQSSVQNAVEEQAHKTNISCPVNHNSQENAVCPLGYGKESSDGDSGATECPVSEEARNVWLAAGRKAAESRAARNNEGCSSDNLDEMGNPPLGANEMVKHADLSDKREVSSIPRTDKDGNWIYPSQQQFFQAMKRKQWEPEAQDMKTVVPLHNMVNEVAWNYIKYWEHGQGGEKCGGIKLTSFKGNAHKLTPRAFIGHYLFGRDLPFDRHDWTIDRCGKRVDYVIDFYTKMPGKDSQTTEPTFYLDVRPKLNTFEGLRLRVAKAFED